MSNEAKAQIHDGRLQTALRLLQSQNKHRVKVFDQWDGSTTDYYIDNIRLEAASGMVTGFSGGERVFTMTTLQFSQYAANGKASTYYEIDHCSIRKDYTRVGL